MNDTTEKAPDLKKAIEEAHFPYLQFQTFAETFREDLLTLPFLDGDEEEIEEGETVNPLSKEWNTLLEKFSEEFDALVDRYTNQAIALEAKAHEQSA